MAFYILLVIVTYGAVSTYKYKEGGF